MFNSLKIPFAFLMTGICWALFSNPLISLVAKHLKPGEQDIYRSLNDFIFVVIIAFVLYVEIKRQKNKLAKSEEEYRQLFESNPNPMWIYNHDNLRFIRVNNAATEKYAYNKHKFLRMTINDIRSVEDHESPADFKNKQKDGSNLSGIRKHRKGTGEAFDVSIISHPVLFNDQQCSLVMATDISELIEKENKLQDAYQKIKNANEALLKISWSNSHELRKPVCSMLGLISLLKQATSKYEMNEILELMEKCSMELDRVLRRNSKQVTEMEMAEELSY